MNIFYPKQHINIYKAYENLIWKSATKVKKGRIFNFQLLIIPSNSQQITRKFKQTSNYVSKMIHN